MKSLASGNRFDNPGESPADHSISEHLRAQVSGLGAAKANAENAQSFIHVAEGGLNEQNNILIRLRELAVAAASDTFSDRDRELFHHEFDQLQQELDRIANTTQFGGTKLLSGENKEYEFQVGAYKGADNIIAYRSDTDTRASALDVDSISVESKYDARDAIETLDNALDKIGEARASFGAIQSRMDSAINNAGIQIENLEAAHSRMADTNFAQATSDMYKQQALQQYQISVLSEANRFPGSVIRLIG